MQQERARGTRLVLLARCEAPLARAIAEHLGGFDEILAATPAGTRPESLGPESFRLATGRSESLAVAAGAQSLWIAEAGPEARQRLESAGRPVEVLGQPHAPAWRRWLKALRVHQWAKNLLLFVPVIAAHRATDASRAVDALVAFACFSVCASSVYLLNDLLDLPSDRRHAKKSKRPFAAGTLPLGMGLVLVPVLLVAGFGTAALLLPPQFLALLGTYYAATLAYSFWLKQVAILDVLLLSGLYTVRVLGGGLATDVPVSDWLLIFAIFLFLSLALVKRLSEVQKLGPDAEAHGRGYQHGDASSLGQLGVSAGYIAVLVLALYIHSPEVTRLYARPEWLWVLCPVALYWVSRVWLLTHRGQMEDDPVVFALRDRVSHVVAVAAGVVLWLAT